MDAHKTSIVPAGGDIPAFFFVSAHGGAGASTLARLIAPGFDAGHLWPAVETHPYVFVVAADGVEPLDKAHRMLSSVPEAMTVLGLVVVPYAPGKPSRAVTAKLRVLSAITQVFHAPYLKGVREMPLSDLPQWSPGDDAPGRLRRVKNSISHSISPLAGQLCRRFVEVYANDDTDKD